MPAPNEQELSRLTAQLAGLAGAYDATGQWPERSIEAVGQAGGWGWAVPRKYGGDPLAPTDMLRVYEALSAGCLSTALIMTQRDGAVELIATADDEGLKQRLLPALARGEIHTTVGISQLTTSRRAGGHLLTVQPEGNGYRLDGQMPWATGAERAAVIVTGGVLPRGEQVLACVPTDRAGITVEAPDGLMALSASRTSRVRCANVRVEPKEVIGEPSAGALSMRTPVKPLVTSVCGLGMAGALQAEIATAPKAVRGHFQEAIEPLTRRYEAVRGALYAAVEAAQAGDGDIAAGDIRVAVNDLVVRSAVAALTLAKGGGFVKGRPVERLVREALFFLVWAATPGVRLETLIAMIGPLPRGADGRDPR